MKKFILILLFAMTALNLSASQKWEHSLSLGFNKTKGNSETEQLNSDYKGKRKWLKANALFSLYVNSGKENQVETTQNYGADFQYNRYLSERLYWLVNTSYKIDKQADLEGRFLLGPGLGYSFMKNAKSALDFEAGVSYLQTKYDMVASQNDTAVRIAQNYSRKLSDTAKLWQSAEYLASADDTDEYIFDAELGVEAKLAASFNLKTFINNKYTNRPASNKKNNDTAFTTMLVYTF
jgi:putative salt-induced outer membrane protein